MMRNTLHGYGWVSLVLHWTMAAAVVGMAGLGLYMVELDYYDSLYKTLPWVHKSVGILLVPVLLFRFAWRLGNPVPEPVAGVGRSEARFSYATHWAFYALIALIMLSGYLISTADGSVIDVFGLFSVPATLTGIPQQEDVAGLAHEYLGYGLIALILVHTAAAIKHHFIDKDDTLRRMLGSSANQA